MRRLLRWLLRIVGLAPRAQHVVVVIVREPHWWQHQRTNVEERRRWPN